MTLRSSDLQSDSDLDSIRNPCDVYLQIPFERGHFLSQHCKYWKSSWQKSKPPQDILNQLETFFRKKGKYEFLDHEQPTSKVDWVAHHAMNAVQWDSHNSDQISCQNKLVGQFCFICLRQCTFGLGDQLGFQVGKFILVYLYFNPQIPKMFATFSTIVMSRG